MVIVQNQKSEFEKFTAQEFADHIFSKQRLLFLEKCGYGIVKLKDEKTFVELKTGSNSPRTLTLILRPQFKPADMKQMQLAAERILATGNNSSVEAWAARCKLFLYEDVSNGGSSLAFLKQQVNVAKTISKDLADFLSLTGQTIPLSLEDMEKILFLIKKPTLSQDTLKFCELISKQYAFQNILEGSLKRTAWHHYIPELMNEEADCLDDDFKKGMLAHFKDFNSPHQILSIYRLQDLRYRIQYIVNTYLS